MTISLALLEKAHRSRRQTTTALNGTELCSGGMDLNRAYQKCSKPELKINEYSSCVKYIECDGHRIGRLPQGDHGKSRDPGCRVVHGYGLIVCYEYISATSSVWINVIIIIKNMAYRNIGTQGVQELFFVIKRL